MNRKLGLLSIALLLGLSSCDLARIGEEFGRSNNPVAYIERGMDQRQVQDLLGRPDNRRFSEDGTEEWEYRRSYGSLEGKIVLVTFSSSGRVIRLNTYNAEGYGRSRRDYPSYPNYPSYPSYPNYPRGGGNYPYDNGQSERENEEWFNDVLRTARRKTFEDERIAYIQDVARGYRFTTKQTIRLLQLFTWDDQKLKVLSPIAPRLRDPYNAYQIIDCFTFSDAKEQARRMLGLSR